ncbi:esterase [Streptomyces sp. TSRI0445]|uniref:Probable esterase/lipase n=1 Tax=Streptomyces globisporus TaxID=1908 RepID=A0ABN8V8J2_STRGL|nr:MULTISPECIES: alpha/beta fold hydrolase [Streptomyces]OKI63680.1 esterase [Streptomyces sp. TSRI0445]RDL01287.1 alpha-beta hydrolase superfamily lysophospholipase [Streptomyces sp. HB202]UIZ13515.1 alpha/beta fold hydrolase [Streptomyces sp. R527F]WGL47843.1 esterase [Streptomyces globisporus]CAH9419160.1 Probable esterase/lipase [Streptomyces globisporus]
MTLRPLHHRLGDRVEEIPFTASDGTELGLCRVAPEDGSTDRPVVLVLHGLTASADMFTLPETRNLVDVLLDAGYEPWLLDWRGSCRLPYNEGRVRYTFDDVALYDIPEAVALIRERIDGRPLLAVAHCIGALCLSLSMAAGLVPGLTGVVAQGVFLTPKMSWKTRARLHFGGELLRSRLVNIPTDFKKVGFWSKPSLIFAEVSLGAECKDPNCQILHNDSWGVGGSLFVHDNLHDTTHDRLAELYGTVPMWILPHLRSIELAHTMMRYNDSDGRYDALPKNALDHAGSFDAPLMLLSGSDNRFWYDSNEICHDVLTRRNPELDVRYVEVPGYGHLDAFIGRNAALDVFGHIVDFLDECLTRPPGRVGAGTGSGAR